MGNPYLFICQPVILSTRVDMSRGRMHGIMGIPYLFTCRPVNLSTRVDRSGGKYRSAGHYGYFVLVQLSTCQPFYQGCSPVDLPTCLPELTGLGVIIGVQGIIGIPYLFTCRPVNLSTRVDRSRGKYMSARHYGYFVLVHLSTCQHVYQG